MPSRKRRREMPAGAELSRFKQRLLLANAAALAVLVAAGLWTAHASREAHLARARQAAADLALGLSQNIATRLSQVDDSLQATLRRLAELRQAQGQPDLGELARIAEQERIRGPGLDALRVTDANGLVLNPGDRPAVSMADRDYFRAARATPMQTVVSEPLRGRLIGGWGLVLARARLDAEGHFTGVVYASLKTERLRDELKRADVGPQGAATLRSRSLQLIARHAPRDANPETGTGTTKVSDALRAALASDAARGSFVARTVLDGVERVTAYEAVPGYPLLMLVGLGTEDVYAAWHRDVGLLAAGLLGLQALLGVLSVRAWRARVRRPA